MNNEPKIRVRKISDAERYVMQYGADAYKPQAEQASQPTPQPLNGLSNQDIQALIALRQRQARQAQQTRPPQQPRYAEHAFAAAPRLPEKSRKSQEKAARRKKIGKVGLIASAVTVVVAAGYTVYDTNAFGVQDNITQFLQPLQTIQENDGDAFDAQTIETLDLGLDGFDLKTCDKPEAVLQVVTIESATLPLVPLINSSEDKTLKKVDPFLVEENISAGIPENKVTESGYPEAVFEDLKLGISICATGKDAIVEYGDGTFDITRDALTVKFKDLGVLYPDVGFISAKLNPTDTNAADPDKGEYVSYDDPTLFIKRGSDEVQNKTLDSLSSAMTTESQMKYIYAMAEESFRSNVIDITSDNFIEKNFPGGATTIKQVIQNTIIESLGVSKEKVNFKGKSDFIYEADVPLDPNTKNPITEPDKKGKVALVNLDPTQQLENIKVSIQSGSLSRPIKPSPGPTPLPSPSPTTAP